MKSITPEFLLGRSPRAVSSLLGLALSAVAAALALSYRAFNQRVRRDIERLVSASGAKCDATATEEMLSDVPAPMQRYLRYTGVLGRPFVHTVHLKQTGRIRMGERAWMPLDASEVFTVEPPGFVWDCTLRAGPLPAVRARDMYQAGKGDMLIKLGALLTVADAAGEEMDQGEMVRYFSEMIWFPTSFLGNNISVSPIDDHTVQATLSDHGREVSATLCIDDEGRLTEFRAERYGVGDQQELKTWSVQVTGYGAFEGLKLPVKLKAIWKLPEGDQEYIDIAVTELDYDVHSGTEGDLAANQRARTPADALT